MNLCGFEVGLHRPLFLIAGPCVVESEQLQIDVAGRLKEICARLKVPFIFKSSYDKANRSSSQSFRGLGMDEGLRILAEVKRQLGVPVLTDVHESDEIAQVATVVDVLQTPAFLCRQTDFIRAVAAAGKPVNIKKGQFLAPEDMANVVAKAREASGTDNIMVCERGASFGYHNLVSDMRSLAIMRATGCPVVFDAPHSVQWPGAQGTSSGGRREFVPVLTDVHESDEIAQVAAVVDVLQTPAFLCRQTDFIRAVAAAGKPVNIKKGQFLAPEDMANVVAKAREASGTDNIMVCERGASFGYHNLVSDMRALAIMRATGCPVGFDATHSVQLPGAQGTSSGGRREFVPVLARAAVAAGVAGVFMETHPEPAKALSDGPNAWPLDRLQALLPTLVELDATVKRAGFPEIELMAMEV